MSLPLPRCRGKLAGSGLSVGAAPPGGSRNAFEVAQSTCNIIGAGGATFALASSGVGSASTPFSFDPNADGVPGFGAGDAAANSVRDLAAGRLALALPGGYTNCNNMVRLFNRGTATIDDITAAALTNTQSYRLHYPKDVQTVGLSLSTTVSGIAVQAEATYRHDQPFNYAFAEQAALANDLSGLNSVCHPRATGRRGSAHSAFRPAWACSRSSPAPAPDRAASTCWMRRFLASYLRRYPALNQTAARSGQTTFTDVAAMQEAILGLAPGAINRGTPPIPGLPVIGLRREIPAALADRAAAGTLTAADVLGILPSTAADLAARGIPFNDAAARGRAGCRDL